MATQIQPQMNVTTQELQTALEQLASNLGLSVKEFVESLGYAKSTDLNTAVADLQNQINAITELDANNGATSLAEKIRDIEAVLSDENGVVQAIYSQIQANKQALNDEVTRATTAETDLQNQITGAVNRITQNEQEIANTKTLASNLAGQAEANAKSYTDAKASNLQSQIDSITGAGAGGGVSLTSLDGRLKVVEDDLNDTTDANGNTVKGVKSRLADVEANMLKASDLDICAIGNKFRASLGLSAIDCSGNGGTSGDGAVI